MAITTGDFINTNRLKTSSGAPSQLNYGGTKIYRAYYGNQLIWDVWRTTLSANDFNIISKGGNVSDYTTVESYYLDALDNKNNLAYTFNPSSIGTRLETTSTTHNVKVTQTATGKSITIKATQAGAVYTTSSTVTTTQVEAKGGNSTVTVSWTLYKDGEVYKTGTSVPTSISGTDVSGDNITCTVDGVKVKVPSAEKATYSNARTVFHVMNWTFVADGKTFSGSGKVAVLQAENKFIGTTSGAYNLSISANSTAAMANSGGTRTITVGCTQNKTDNYSSGFEDPYTVNATATVSTNTGWFNGNSSLTSTTVTGSGKLTLTVLENIGAARTITVTAAVSNVTKTVSFTQNAVSYEFYTAGANVDVAYNETSVVLTGVSRRNGSGLDIQKSHVDVSGGASIDKYNLPTNDGNGNFTITLSFSANDTTKNTYTVIVTQPGSGKTITYTVTHAAKPGGGSGGGSSSVFRLENGSLGMIAGGIKGTATLVYHKDYYNKEATVSLLINGTHASSTNYKLTGTATENTIKVEVSKKTSFMDGVDVAELKATCGGASSTITLS